MRKKPGRTLFAATWGSNRGYIVPKGRSEEFWTHSLTLWKSDILLVKEPPRWGTAMRTKLVYSAPVSVTDSLDEPIHDAEVLEALDGIVCLKRRCWSTWST